MNKIWDAARQESAQLMKLADPLGVPGALCLVAMHGGGELSVPRTLKPGHSLINLLGQADAEKLVEVFGGRVIDVPRLDFFKLATRAAAAHQMRKSGLELRQIAGRLACSEKSARGLIELGAAVNPKTKGKWLETDARLAGGMCDEL